MSVRHSVASLITFLPHHVCNNEATRLFVDSAFSLTPCTYCYERHTSYISKAVVKESENNVRDIPQNSISNLDIMDSVGSIAL